MNIIQRMASRWFGDTSLPQAKAAYNVVPVGVQGRPYPRTYDATRLISAARTNEVVYACISTKQRTAVDPRLYVERRQSDGQWLEIDGHPLRRLIMRPNPDMDEINFWQWFIASRETCGEFYAEIVRSSKAGPPVALYPLNPALVDPIPNSDGTIGAYQWRLGYLKQIIPAEDMLVWRNVDIGNRWRGLSPLSVALGAVGGDIAQTDYVNEFFRVGGIPAGLMTIKGRTVTPLEAEEIREKWRAKFSPSSGGNMSDIAVMDENAEFQVLGSKLDELSSEELRGVAESRICMVFGVPPLVIYAYIGMLRSIQSNLREAWQQFWDSTLTPEYRAMRQWLTTRMLSEFESDDLVMGERVRCQWDMLQVAALQDDVDGMQRRARENYTAGGITRNEFRAVIGAPPDDVHGNDYATPAQPTGAPEPTKRAAPIARKAVTKADDDDIERIDASREKIVGKAVVKIEKYLRDEYEAASDRIKRDGVDAATTGADDGAKLARVMQPFYRLSLRAAYDDTNVLLADQDISVSFDLENPRVADTINALLQQVKRDIPETTIEDIRAAIANGLREGWGTDRIGDELRAAAPQISQRRADTIARTEVARAHSRGALLSYEDSGVVSEVEWNATLDNKTSEICQRLHGQRAGLGEAFESGISEPPAHPNCRSVLLPVVN
jgi:HK97 family phage portal protein